MNNDSPILTPLEIERSLRFLRALEVDGKAYLDELMAIDPESADAETFVLLRSTAADWDESRRGIEQTLRTALHRLAVAQEQESRGPSWLDAFEEMPEPEPIFLTRLRPRSNPRQEASIGSVIFLVWAMSLVVGFFAGMVVRGYLP